MIQYAAFACVTELASQGNIKKYRFGYYTYNTGLF